MGLEASEVIEKRSGFLLKMAADYNGIGKIQYILGKKGLPTIASEYGADVTLEVLVPEEEEKGLKEEITEGNQRQDRLPGRKGCPLRDTQRRHAAD